MSRILNMSEQHAVQTLAAKGFSLRWISRELHLNRRTVARTSRPVRNPNSPRPRFMIRKSSIRRSAATCLTASGKSGTRS